MKPAHLVCFRIGHENFCVDIFAVREIVRVQEITKVPGAPDFVRGVINLRGRIISVVDLGHQLGLGRTFVRAISILNDSGNHLVISPPTLLESQNLIISNSELETLVVPLKTSMGVVVVNVAITTG